MHVSVVTVCLRWWGGGGGGGGHVHGDVYVHVLMCSCVCAYSVVCKHFLLL